MNRFDVDSRRFPTLFDKGRELAGRAGLTTGCVLIFPDGLAIPVGSFEDAERIVAASPPRGRQFCLTIDLGNA